MGTPYNEPPIDDVCVLYCHQYVPVRIKSQHSADGPRVDVSAEQCHLCVLCVASVSECQQRHQELHVRCSAGCSIINKVKPSAVRTHGY